MNQLSDVFKHKSGSNVQPSTDPNDSEYDEFTCNLCGWSFSMRMYGCFDIGHDPWKDAKEKQMEHFIEVVNSDKSPKCTLDDGKQAVLLALKALNKVG